jgi:hypothetical protein
MSLPKLPEPDFTLDMGDTNCYYDETMLAFQAATVEACAVVAEARQTPGTGSVAILQGASDAIRAMLKEKTE